MPVAAMAMTSARSLSAGHPVGEAATVRSIISSERFAESAREPARGSGVRVASLRQVWPSAGGDGMSLLSTGGPAAWAKSSKASRTGVRSRLVESRSTYGRHNARSPAAPGFLDRTSRLPRNASAGSAQATSFYRASRPNAWAGRGEGSLRGRPVGEASSSWPRTDRKPSPRWDVLAHRRDADNACIGICRDEHVGVATGESPSPDLDLGGGSAASHRPHA